MQREWLGLCIGVLWCGMAAAQIIDISSRPMNPDYIAYTNHIARENRLGVRSAESKYKQGYIPPIFDTSHLCTRSKSGLRVRAQESLPSRYDLREHQKLPPIKNQNPYGTCWTFAFCAAAESQLLPTYSSDFSEWAFAHSTPFDTGWNDGGNFYRAAAIATSWQALRDEQDCRYGTGSIDESVKNNYSHIPVLWHVKELHFLTDDTEDIKRELMQYGAIAISYDHGDTYYKTYQYQGVSTTTYCSPGGFVSGHAITIIGWDDNFPAAGFVTRPSRDGAWLCRNSWGADWGMGGYFYMSYVEPTLEYEGCIAQTVPADEDADRLWTHSPLGVCNIVELPTPLYVANVYRPTETQDVTGIGFYSADNGVTYDISLYCGGDGTTPVSGTCVYGEGGLLGATLTHSPEFAGYYSLNLPEPIPVASGERFAIIMRATKPGSATVDFPIEYPIGGASAATASPGESFSSSDGGLSWYDESSDGFNLCLDVFANVADLPAPTNVVATMDSSTHAVRLTWDPVIKADAYGVYRAPFGKTFAEAEYLGVGLSSPLYDHGGSPEVQYSYWVQAGEYKTGRDSAPSGPVSGRKLSLSDYQRVAVALGTDFIPWTMGGSAGWFGQMAVYAPDANRNDMAAARSGSITHNQASTMTTTVTGSGTLIFDWKVSSESAYLPSSGDFLQFIYNGTIIEKIKGATQWARKTYTLDEGIHTLQWRYVKDGSVSKNSTVAGSIISTGYPIVTRLLISRFRP